MSEDAKPQARSIFDLKPASLNHKAVLNSPKVADPPETPKSETPFTPTPHQAYEGILHYPSHRLL